MKRGTNIHKPWLFLCLFWANITGYSFRLHFHCYVGVLACSFLLHVAFMAFFFCVCSSLQNICFDLMIWDGEGEERLKKTDEMRGQ